MFETDLKAVATAFNNSFVNIAENIAEVFEGSSEGFMFNTRLPIDTSYSMSSIEPALVLKENERALRPLVLIE